MFTFSKLWTADSLIQKSLVHQATHIKYVKNALQLYRTVENANA